MNEPKPGIEAVAHLIAAMHDRPDRIASALWAWQRRHQRPAEQLLGLLCCSSATLERLALLPRPRPGDDWEVDVEIIAISLRLRHTGLRAILLEADQPLTREIGGRAG